MSTAPWDDFPAEAALDVWAELYGLKRAPDESDDALRARLQKALEPPPETMDRRMMRARWWAGLDGDFE